MVEQLAEGASANTPCWTFYAKGSNPRVRVLLTYCRPLELGVGALNRVVFEWIGSGVRGGPEVERLVDAAFKLPGAAYGYVTTSERREAQHIVGTLNQRIPGVFYMNVFGLEYMRFFGDRLAQCHWQRSEQSDDRFTGWLFHSLDDASDDTGAGLREDEIKTCLGRGYFDGSQAVPQVAAGGNDSQELQNSTAGAVDIKELGRLADAWASSAARQGVALDYSPDSLASSDQLISEIWGLHPPENLREVAEVVGAYLGEVIRRHVGGEWAFNDEFRTVGISRRGSWIFPMSRAEKRLVDGAGDSLASFYAVVREQC